MFLHFAKSANLNRKINSALHSPTSNKLRKIEALFGILKTFLHTVNNVRSIDGAQNKENIRLLDTSIVHSGRAGRRGRWKVLRKLPYNNNITPYIKYTWYYYCAQAATTARLHYVLETGTGTHKGFIQEMQPLYSLCRLTRDDSTIT